MIPHHRLSLVCVTATNMQLKFGIEGELQLSRAFQGISVSMQDWAPSMNESVTMLKEMFSGDVFDTEGEAIDESWSPLSRAYAKQKEKKFGDAGILQATGTMRGSFVSQFDSTSAQIWNSAMYFKYHQSKEPRIKIPRRVMMKLTENLKQAIVKIFHEQIYTAING